MAQCLSNIITSHPVLYQKNTTSNTTIWPFSSNGLKNGKVSIKASVSKDSLDHLQRTNNYKPQQQQFKKKTPQVTPIGILDRYPTARTVQQMLDTMDRIMDDPLAYSSGNGSAWPLQLRSTESGRYNRARTPWEIKEKEGDYKMRFDMPGMTKQDVKVWVEEKMLVVKAEKKMETSEEKKGSDKEEEWPAESFGKYSFRIVLPENIQYENIRAEVKDGVLYINIPKASVSSKILDINVE